MIKTIYILGFLLFFAFGEIQAQSSNLKMYGFFDLEAEVTTKDAAGKLWTFDQHHLNIITIYKVDQRFRVYSEVEYEHGPALSSESVQGEFYLANAYLEYKHTDALRIRVGQFVSPFGIYNELHDATPSIVSTKLPHSVYGEHRLSTGAEGRLYAKFSTGIQLLGNLFSGRWEGAYHVYLSNGRGPASAEQDNNANKGVGFRLSISPPISGLRLGSSFYTDQNGLDGDTRHRTFAFDAEFDHTNFHLESEMIFFSLQEVDLANVPIDRYRRGRGSYVLASYRIRDRLTPFARYEIINHDLDLENTIHDNFMIGLNFAVTSKVYIKNEVHFHNAFKSNEPSYELYVTSVAVAL